MIGKPFELDITTSSLEWNREREKVQSSGVLDEALSIRQKPVETFDDDLGALLGLKVARGIWTPIEIHQPKLYRVPATIYYTDDGPTRIDENHDLNREMTAVLGQPPNDEETRLARDRLLKEMLTNERNIAIITAHGEDLEEPPHWNKKFWSYTDKNKMPKKVSDMVREMQGKYDVLVLSICNPGRILLSDITTPTFYPLDSISILRDNPNARLKYSGSA